MNNFFNNTKDSMIKACANTIIGAILTFCSLESMGETEFDKRYAWLHLSMSVYGSGLGMSVTPRESKSIYSVQLMRHHEEDILSGSFANGRDYSLSGEVTEISLLKNWHGIASNSYANFGVGLGFATGQWKEYYEEIGDTEIRAYQRNDLSTIGLVIDFSAILGRKAGFGFYAHGFYGDDISSTMLGFRIPLGRFN